MEAKRRYWPVNMANVVRAFRGPESKVAAGLAGLVGAVGLCVAVTMTSCEISDRSSRRLRNDTDPQVRDVARSVPAKSDLPSVNRAPTQVATGEPRMRVRILAGVNTVTVQAGGGLQVGQGDPKGAVALPENAKTEPFGPSASISLVNGQWIVAAGASTRVFAAGSAGGSLVLAASALGAPVQVNGTTYPGMIRLTTRSDLSAGSFDVVDFVAIEDYLPGVVAKEMLAGWPLGAYQAQAVAARTYAMQERERSIGVGATFDVESTDRDQVFGGVTTNKLAIQAVQSTRGFALTDGGKVLRAYFSSTCGGRTASAKDTWPTGPGFEFNLAAPIQSYTRDSACSGSPLYRWTVERPRGELVQRLRLFGERNQLMVRRLRDLQAIEPMGVTQDGRPNRFKIIEPGGTWYQLSAEELRLACNTSGATTGIPVVGASPMNGPVVAGRADVPSGTVPGMSGGAISPELARTTVLPDVDRKTRVHSSDIEVSVVGDRVTIRGRGFGHGVGLCQYCAKAFAERGEDWKTMLQRFYPGAKLDKLY